MTQGESGRRTSVEIAAAYRETSAKITEVQEKMAEGKPVKKEEIDDLKKELDMDEHKISQQELVERLNTNVERGLSEADVPGLVEIYGKNMLTPPKSVPEWKKYLLQYLDYFAILLEVGSILSFIGYAIDTDAIENLYIAVVLISVVFITATFTYLQERHSSKLMEKFKDFLPTQATCLRDGEKKKINAIELVPGDICEVIAGQKIPADLRVMSCTNFKVDNASLTGEAEPQSRSPECTDPNPLETKNLAFYGTLATDGSCVGVVVGTGDRTVIGRIAGLAAATENTETPIHREIHRFIKIISAVAIFLGVTFFIIGMVISGGDWITNLVFMIGIIVANVPEGLLATVTVSLTLTAKRMAEKKVLVKNLESVETLGSTTVIASDKTGTLTQNLMTVSHIYFDSEIFDCETSTQKDGFNKDSETFAAMLRCATLCNRATFDPHDADKPINEKNTIGDASESALIKFAQRYRGIEEHRKANPKIFEIPFNSLNKYQLSVHKSERDGKHILVMKGAPERILDRCASVLENGKVVPMTDEYRNNKFQKAYETLGSMGERVLGFAELSLDDPKFTDGYEYDGDNDGNFPMSDLCFLGLYALIDPPRPAVPGAVAKCQSAGIRVIMVTGDHPITAQAIARQVGIITGQTAEDLAKKEGVTADKITPGRADAIVRTGTQIRDFELEDWDHTLDHKQVVFARTSPTQKLVIVENLQRRGEIVAVTGDGVNDSPALKRADIGVAMGISGSDVSKEAAHMILLDDNFASIVNGVEEGRLIFDNLKKSIAYTLSSNIPEITPFLLFITLSLPLPLSTILILCVDLGTDMVPAISLAYEEAESDIMKRRPRNAKTDNLVTSRLISFSYFQIGIAQALAGFYTYFVVMGDKGFPPYMLVGSALLWEDENQIVNGRNWFDRKEGLIHAQTAFFVSIVIVQWADLLICKTRKLSIFQQSVNWRLVFGLFFETCLAVILCYTPPLNTVLGTRPIKFVHWLPGLPWSLLIFTYDELRKWILRLRPGGWLDRKSYY